MTNSHFEGMHLSEAAALIGKPRPETRRWLYARGFTAPDNVIRRIKTAVQVEEAIRQRVASLPPPEPCWRCAARGSCQHRTVAEDPRTLAASSTPTTNEGTTQL